MAVREVAVREVPTDSGPTDYLLFEVSILSDVSGGPGKPSCGWRKKPGSVC